jgi:hypothetical protein
MQGQETGMCNEINYLKMVLAKYKSVGQIDEEISVGG